MSTIFKLVCFDWVSEERDKYIWEDLYCYSWDEIIGRMYLLKANGSIANNRYRNALIALDQALKLLAKKGVRQEYYCRALADKAVVLCFLEQYAAALATIDQALGIANDYFHPMIANNRCSILILNGAFSEALDALDVQLAQSTQYDHSDLLFTRATCLLHMKRYDESVVAYEQAIAEDKCLEDNSEGLEAALQHQQPDWDEL